MATKAPRPCEQSSMDCLTFVTFLPANYCKVWCLQPRTTRSATVSLCMISISVILFNTINAHYAHKILIPSADKSNKKKFPEFREIRLQQWTYLSPAAFLLLQNILIQF